MTSRLRQKVGAGLLALAALAVLAVAGCNADGSLNGVFAVGGTADKGTGAGGVVTGVALPYDQELLAYFWEGSVHNDWDVISGVIDPAVGGRISGVPASWPRDKEYLFALSFPAGALPGTEPLEISILVPRDTFGDPHSAVIRLEPDGLVFNDRVTVQFCYPPWLKAGDNYGKFCLKQAINPDGPWYSVTDYAKVLPSAEDDALGLIFKTTHFSRWGMQNGQGGDEGQTNDGPDRDQIRTRR